MLCGNIINKVYCDNFSIVKLACSDTRVNNIYGLFFTVISSIPLLLILYTYMRILRVCFSGSKQTRQKALILYGLKMSKIRIICKRLLCGEV
ncbi:Olfactory receptor 52N4 [Dissostichus eleginoides]|uniref:Olfactory receptor 52N4 n=1 Tax=Dissostichus eleginoides TaxID=100907 RepID=A0AAD9FGI4_DISEL|nr:Olfactory receptor 52N4 [Dissostichus eleginoides]